MKQKIDIKQRKKSLKSEAGSWKRHKIDKPLAWLIKKKEKTNYQHRE